MAWWSSPKDPALEAALRRNRRWIVNNQIKRLLLRFPSRTAPVRLLQSRFKTLDLLGRASNWLRKYPSCFDLFHGPAASAGGEEEEWWFGFTKRMGALVDAEEAAVAASEPAMADRLARVLMLARGRRIQVSKLAALRGPLGFPDDYLLRLLPGRAHLFRLANPYPHRRNAAELELLRWVPSLAVSSVKAAAVATDSAPRFACSLPPSWINSHAKMEEFNSTPYISPYSENWGVIGSDGDAAEKRAVAVVHELLSLTLWKKMSVLKLEHFRREFGLPEDIARMLHRHPCLFYVSNRYKIHTVVLREGYEGSELKEKDPVVAAKDRLGELMQEGLHEYNQRRREANLEKRRRIGEIEIKQEQKEDDEEVARLDSAEKREERRKFYKNLENIGT
uniref:PORR domain-containing protein n=1 Tax=Leersia perrieri TaxID=77586 RepID=A0A0D9WP40_9ORYZ